jgi:hypothetical protein
LKTKLDLRIRLSLNRKASKPEIKALIKYIANDLLDTQRNGKHLYDIEWGAHPQHPLKVEHHFVSRLKDTTYFNNDDILLRLKNEPL